VSVVECRRTESRLYVRVERRGVVVVLKLEGRLTLETDVHQLCRLAKWLTRLEGSLVMLDLKCVRQLDCTGLGQLVALCNDVRGRGGRCALVHMESRQRSLLRLAGLLGVLPVFDTCQHAVDWFQGTSGQPSAPAMTKPWMTGWTLRFPVSAAGMSERRLKRSNDRP
jgi:anti-anti-sigma factor